MVEEEALDDDTLGDQVERGDSDWRAAHQSIDDERPGLAENAGYGCGGFACDPVNAERHAGVADRRPNFVDRPTLIDDHRSEEHTAELQSPCNLGSPLLLGKKNKIYAR